MRSLTLGMVAALLGPVLSGCVSRFGGTTPEQRLVSEGKYDLIEGLIAPASTGTEGCGAAALATALTHLGSEGTDAAVLAAELPWHDLGATPVDLLLEARERGFAARVLRGNLNTLVSAIDRRHPPIVMLDARAVVTTPVSEIEGPKQMHWAVVSGVAHDLSAITLIAPESRHHVIDRTDFLERWSASDNCVILIERRPPETKNLGN